MIFCMYIFWHETGDKTFRNFRVESMFLLVKYKKSGKCTEIFRSQGREYVFISVI